MYFSHFLSSTASATFPGSWVACAKGAKVFGQGASQTIRQPVHGASVTPSGLFPSDLKRPTGSSLEGTCAADNPRLMMSFSAARGVRRGVQGVQVNPPFFKLIIFISWLGMHV